MSRYLRGRLGCLVLVLAGMLPVAANALVIAVDTTPGTSYAEPFGDSGNRFYGEITSMPAGIERLISMTFYIEALEGTVDIVAGIRMWGNFRPVGRDVFRSAPLSVPRSGHVEAFTFTPDLAFDQASAWLLYLEAVDDGLPGRARLPKRDDNPYENGSFWQSVDGSNWAPGGLPGGESDLAFKVEFWVPEPPLPWLVLTAFGVLCPFVRSHPRRGASAIRDAGRAPA